MGIELAQVDTIIDKHNADQRALISLLLDIQDQFYYLPQEALERVADKVGVPSIQVYQVARFYKAFSLTPRGKHLLTVCVGTACHVRGGDRLVDQLSRLLKVAPGETTEGPIVHAANRQLPGMLRFGSRDGCGRNVPWQDVLHQN